MHSTHVHLGFKMCTLMPKGGQIQADTKKRELLKNPTKIEEIQKKKKLTEIEPLKLAF